MAKETENGACVPRMCMSLSSSHCFCHHQGPKATRAIWKRALQASVILSEPEVPLLAHCLPEEELQSSPILGMPAEWASSGQPGEAEAKRTLGKVGGVRLENVLKTRAVISHKRWAQPGHATEKPKAHSSAHPQRCSRNLGRHG